MTDTELIACFRAGETDAFNALAGRWHRRLYNFIRRYLGDPEEAQDLCQQTFVRAYQSIRRLRDPQKFSTWLYQIAFNTCRDELRRRQRQPILSLENLEEHSDNPQLESPAPPDAGAHERDLRDLLNRALQAIPEEQRVVVVMKEYQRLKFVEIAAVLQVPENTVKSRLYYGLSNLRKVLAQWNITQEMLDYEV